MQPRKGSWPKATRASCAMNQRFLSYITSSLAPRPTCQRIKEGNPMPVEKSYARLGAFIMVTMLVVLLTAIFFIQRMKQRPAMSMVTFTTENVFGLDVSSPVRLRGVPVGRVTNIRVNPRGTLVEIDFEVYLDHLNTIGLDVHRLQTVRDIGGVFPNLRAQ